MSQAGCVSCVIKLLIEVRNCGDACLCDALNMNMWNASITA